MENRHALVIDTGLTLATGIAERTAALEMVAARPGKHRITLAADKAYDVAGFVADLRTHNVTPHVAQNTTNRPSIDGRTTRHPGYAVSGRVRKRIEEVFGWTKAVAGFRKTRHRGLARRRPDVHAYCHCLQSHPAAQAGGGPGVAMPGIWPDTAKTGEIDAKTCMASLFHNLREIIS
jgi:IS5 family transposase